MEYLIRSRCTVLKLEDAVEQLQQNSLQGTSVVITIDDGWYGCLTGMFPVLDDLGLDATLYLTTYYAERREPVFDVAVGYLFWKTEASIVNLDGLGGLHGELDLSTPEARDAASDSIVDDGNAELDNTERHALLEQLANRLNVDYGSIAHEKRFQLVSLENVNALRDSGVDVQLHTHRHRLDLENRDEVEREIRENRERLEPLLGKRLQHFCYPSGVHHPRIYPWLQALEVETATTTRTGLCYETSPPLALPRIVDGEDVSQIEFEAEIAGTLELARRMRSWFTG